MMLLRMGGSFLMLAVATGFAHAQTPCQTTGGPDLIIADIIGPANYSADGDFEAFAIGRQHCNVGSQPLDFVSNTNRHPVFGSNLFKLTADAAGVTRIEHLGQSWLQHGFFALSGGLCCPNCQPTDGTRLGIHCSDSNTAARAGTQSALGPKWQVNPVTGEFPFPPANPPFSGTVARRIRVRIAELEPSSSQVEYYVESQAIAPDDAAAGNGFNNVAHRPAVMSGSGSTWNLAFGGATRREAPAIRAWRLRDETVVDHDVMVAGDGWFVVAGDATPLGGGWWRYEYAVQNINSDRAARAFSIPLSPCIVVTNVGFHDVDYHSGDGPGNVDFDGTDWSILRADGRLTWATQMFDQSVSANALRWGTLYNFRLDADSPPRAGGAPAALALFKPGAPESIDTGPIPVPANRTGDLNGDGQVDLGDLSTLLSNFGATDSTPADGDIDADGDVDLDDLSALLSTFGSSCL